MAGRADLLPRDLGMGRPEPAGDAAGCFTNDFNESLDYIESVS
jgi:hypothetical protein